MVNLQIDLCARLSTNINRGIFRYLSTGLGDMCLLLDGKCTNFYTPVLAPISTDFPIGSGSQSWACWKSMNIRGILNSTGNFPIKVNFPLNKILLCRIIIVSNELVVFVCFRNIIYFVNRRPL